MNTYPFLPENYQLTNSLLKKMFHDHDVLYIIDAEPLINSKYILHLYIYSFIHYKANIENH